MYLDLLNGPQLTRYRDVNNQLDPGPSEDAGRHGAGPVHCSELGTAEIWRWVRAKLFYNFTFSAFRWHSRTNQACFDFEKENNQWAFNNLLTNSTNSFNCLCYKFLQTFLLWIYNIYKPYVTARSDNSVHLCVPIIASYSLCQDDWYLAYLCSTYSIFRGQRSIFQHRLSYVLSRFFYTLLWMLWEMMMTEK